MKVSLPFFDHAIVSVLCWLNTDNVAFKIVYLISLLISLRNYTVD